MSTFWRAASLSYLEYVNHASHAVRAALKEPLRSKASSRGNIHLRERWYENGVGGDKTPSSGIVSAIRQAAKKAAQ